MNVERLLKVKEQILKEPELFDMATWGSFKRCNTIHCIGGWALYFDYAERGEKDIGMQTYSGSLDLTLEESAILFYESSWPESFRIRYGGAQSLLERAQVAAERIDHFIATGGLE